MSSSSGVDSFLSALNHEATALRGCFELLNQPEASKTLQDVLDLCFTRTSSGGKLILLGVGKSGKIAQKISATLSSTGTMAAFLHPTEGLHGDLGMVGTHDTVIALSQSGNTEEILRLVPILKDRGLPIIGIGGNPKSQLASKVTHWIPNGVTEEACPNNLAPTTSTTVSLAIGDAIAVALMKLRGFDRAAFAQNHPGGALGQRLHTRVQDLMHGEKIIGTVRAEAKMDEIIVLATQTRLGGVLVTEGRTLLGLITDGDLRRALQHREKFFDLTAREVMTRSPITVRSDQLASDALALMEHRTHQLAVLPVVNPLGEWVGMIRIHDIARLI